MNRARVSLHRCSYWVFFSFFFFFIFAPKNISYPHPSVIIPSSTLHTRLSIYPLSRGVPTPPPLSVVTISRNCYWFWFADIQVSPRSSHPPVKLSPPPSATRFASHFRVSDSTLINDILIDEIFNRERAQRERNNLKFDQGGGVYKVEQDRSATNFHNFLISSYLSLHVRELDGKYIGGGENTREDAILIHARTHTHTHTYYWSI